MDFSVVFYEKITADSALAAHPGTRRVSGNHIKSESGQWSVVSDQGVVLNPLVLREYRPRPAPGRAEREYINLRSSRNPSGCPGAISS